MDSFALVPFREDNLEAVADLGAELMPQSSYSSVFDRRWAIGIARGMMLSDRCWCRLAVSVDGTYCGLIAGSVAPMVFSPDLMAVEETIFVREGTPFRGKIAKEMLRQLSHWAFVEKGAKFIRAGETSGIAPKAVDLFFRQQGFKRAGTLYCKEAS